MKEEKENKNQPKEHEVHTPSPPQVMDPSRSPQESDFDQDSKEKKSRSAKSTKKVKGRSLSPNEEL